ncbi:sugar phosphate isomerase/epimerase family protein [Microbacterium aureliae]
MLIGAHALVFTGTFDREGLTTAVEGASRAGFDLLEIPLMEPEGFDAALAGSLAADHGLAVTASLGLTDATDLTSADEGARAAGERMLEQCIAHVAAMGGDVLCGVIYSAMRKYDRPATAEGVAASQAALGRLARRAADSGVRLSLEIVNRYETNVANTAADGLRLLGGIDGDVTLHLDTYHANIEENSFGDAVRTAGDLLGYVHIGESHRGYLGTGSVDFDDVFAALAARGYDGPVVFESFSSAVVSPSLSNALGIWRNLWDDPHDLAAHARRFIGDGVARAALAHSVSSS